ncbi:MAG: deoxyguanosinetriphosphate triphosphohydrolase [Dehalococcoidia bacterium]
MTATQFEGLNTQATQRKFASVRALLEARERALSPFAARGATSRGRERPEPPSPLRTEFQRDRDRILHCKAFRRLKHKTQVFIAPAGDHYVTRMTHTLEVAQIARTIARALNLNEDLAEAISLAHDIGHAPFGHAGEESLAELLGLTWRHNEQGARVVEKLENDGRGLNLTWETREGIVKSSKVREDIFAEAWGTASTLEGQALKVADAVAYLNHDILDAIRAGILTEASLPPDVHRVLGTSHGERINTLVSDIVAASWAATGEVETEQQPTIEMSPEVRRVTNALREFMFENVYLLEDRQSEVRRAREVLGWLFDYYVRRTDQLPDGFSLPEDPVRLRVADFISGMTDRYAIRQAASLGCRPAQEWLQDGSLFP